MVNHDAFLAAKLDENRESVAAAQYEAEQRKLLARDMETVDITASPYADMSEGSILECCARAGLRDVLSWNREQRIAALEVLRLRRQAEAEAANRTAPTMTSTGRLERYVQPPPPKVAKPQAPPKLKVDQLPPSANGVYRVVKDGRAYINGTAIDFRAGKRIGPSYHPQLQAMLDCGVQLEPEVPIAGDLLDTAEAITALTAERDAALAAVSELEARLTALTLERDIATAGLEQATAERDAAIAERDAALAAAATDDGEDDATESSEATPSSEADTVPPPRGRRRKPQGG